MKVRDIMTVDPALCTPESSLEKVASLMIEYDCGEIPVVDTLENRMPIGVVTDRDIVCRTIGKGLNPLELVASDCMSTPIVSVNADGPLDECCQLMEQNQIRRMLVVDGGKCVGIVVLADIAQSLPKDDSGEVLQEVSIASRSASNVA